MRGMEQSTEQSSKSTGSRSPRKFSLFRRRSSAESSSSLNGFRKRRQRQKTTTVEEEHRDQPADDVTIRTAIMGSYEPVEHAQNKEIVDEVELQPAVEEKQATCATAVFQHSIMLCGQEDSVIEDEIPMPSVPEDPTVQESFECMVASQLEEGLPHDLLWEEDSEDEVVLMSPAALLQSRSNNRLQSLSASPLPKPRKTFRAGSLVHLGTYDPVVDTMSLSPPPKCPDSSQGVSQTPCRCKRGLKAPGENAKKWPQSPLLFRPTPGTDTKVIGIRYAGSKDYLWENGDKHTWTQRLNEDWGRSIERNIRDCNECMVLPINNGNEQRGKSLVVDFRTNVFEGTILLRLRHSNGTTPEPYDDSKGYFEGMNRRYQVVIQGKPLREIPLTECMAGSRLDRPAGKLPPKWILKGAIKVLSFFAPQMSVEIDSDRPNYLTPLGSTPQVLRVNGDLDMEEPQEEPTVAEESILGVATEGNTSLARARLRKKLFDKMFVKKDKEPVLSVNNVYTFEFLQHLFNFTKFTMELGSMLGSVDLSNLLNGQPMQIMAETGDGSKLWSFDIWHESLIAKASEHDKLL